MRVGKLVALNQYGGIIEDRMGELFKFDIKGSLGPLSTSIDVVFEIAYETNWAYDVESATRSFMNFVEKFGTPK